jgi:iron complex transport system substrate-binding protein
LLAGALGPGLPPLAADILPPRRIVSINLCADQLLVDLVPRERIAAVSHLAADPAVSAVHEQAAGIPVTRGQAEHVLTFEPDLVLAGAYSTPATVSLLERLRRRVVKVPLASDLDSIRAVVRQVAGAVGEPARGKAMVAELERRLEAVRHRTYGGDHPSGGGAAARAPSALVYQVNGLTSGAGSLGAAVLGWAGFANHAERLRLGPGGEVGLELMLADPPDLVVLTGPTNEYRTAVAENLRHPAVAHLAATRRLTVVPWRFWLCGTPYVARAVELLDAERRLLEAGAARP